MSTKLIFQGANRALIMATIAFGANFSVWVLYAVLALDLQESYSLSAVELGLLFAAPMLTGAVLRMPAGFLADRYNPKYLYALQMILVVPSLFILPKMETLTDHMLLGLWIGISGTSFTFGISYITDWFERNHQGTAMGIFGAGNAGAAITLALAPYIVEHWGWKTIGPIYGVGLAAMALLFLWWAPSRPKQTEQLSYANEKITLKQIVGTLQIWRFSLYYYFVFGSFLALILWLPQYYTNAYMRC